jgi:hypothetical protein
MVGVGCFDYDTDIDSDFDKSQINFPGTFRLQKCFEQRLKPPFGRKWGLGGGVPFSKVLRPAAEAAARWGRGKRARAPSLLRY